MKLKDDLVRDWVQKADHDLGMAELALENKPEYTDSICFHCQQAVEKCLKAYLVYLDVKFEKKHNLVYLLDLINEQEKVSDDLYDIIEKLEDYAVEIRYPDEAVEPTIEEAKEAFEIAKQIKEFMSNKVHFAGDQQTASGQLPG